MATAVFSLAPWQGRACFTVGFILGSTMTRVARSGIDAIFGAELLMSGFDFVGTLAPGTYDLVVFARNSRTRIFDQLRVVRITVN